MTALIVAESYFGNTAALAETIAEAVASCLTPEVDLLAIAHAPNAVPANTDLLVLAAPTHDYSLPRPQTRSKIRRGRSGQSHSFGLREWIAAVPPCPGLTVVTVDTAVRTWFMPSTAARVAARLLRRRGFGNAKCGATFFVTDYAGPLDDGELVRAGAWVAAVARKFRQATNN
jgi:hypothetical protein